MYFSCLLIFFIIPFFGFFRVCFVFCSLQVYAKFPKYPTCASASTIVLLLTAISPFPTELSTHPPTHPFHLPFQFRFFSPSFHPTKSFSSLSPFPICVCASYFSRLSFMLTFVWPSTRLIVPRQLTRDHEMVVMVVMDEI